MTIESAPGRAVVILSREELERYGVSCAAMSLYDDRTRLLLGDMLAMLAHMGVVSVKTGETPHINIECACGPAGGCMLFFASSRRDGRTVRFAGLDSVSRAAVAGAFEGGLAPVPDGDGYILALPDGIEWWRECLLREFSDDGEIM